MKSIKRIISVVIVLTILVCTLTTTTSAASPIAAPRPDVGIQWVSTSSAWANLTVINGVATISVTVNGIMNVATRIEVEAKLYYLQDGVWKDCGISISDYATGSSFKNSWQRGVILKGTYQAEVIARVYSPNGMDTIYMYPTYEHK